MKQKQSIASKCSAFTAGLVILQSLLVLGMLIAGGILKQTRDTAYQSFASCDPSGPAHSDQIDNRWTNIHPMYRNCPTDCLRAAMGGKWMRVISIGSADTLISMLLSAVPGTFLILDEPGQGKHASSVFQRLTRRHSADNSDLFQVMGPAEYPGDTRFSGQRLALQPVIE